MNSDWLLYRRTSTVEQGKNNTSMETQDQECRKKAAELGHTDEPSYVLTEMESGAFMDRPALEEMLRIVKEALVSLVVIFNPDRLARDPLHLLMIIRIFAEAGVRLEFVHGSSDNSPEGQLLAFCTGWAAQRERTMIAQRSMLGKKATAKAGRMPTGMGPGTYGYDYDPNTKTMTINEAEALVVRLIFQWGSEGVSVYGIAVRLNEKKIPTKTGKRWSRQIVIRILKNTSYYGITRYGKFRHEKIGPKKTRITEQPAEEVIQIEGFTPQIISKSFFEKVQEQLKVPQARGRKQGNRYLLTGFTRCGYCNSPMVGSMRSRGTRYYRCTGAINRPERPPICKAGHVNEKIEQVVWDIVHEAIVNPEILSFEVEQHVVSQDGNLVEEAAKLRKEIAVNKNEQRQLMRLYGKPNTDQELVESELALLKLQCDEKEQAHEVLEEQQRRVDAAVEAKDQIGEYCRRISENINMLDTEGKRAAFSAMGVKVVATRETLSITIAVDPDATTMSQSPP